MDISSGSFYPKPKVESSLLVFSPKKDYVIFKNVNSLEEVTRIIFNERRKKIRNRINRLFNRKINAANCKIALIGQKISIIKI